MRIGTHAKMGMEMGRVHVTMEMGMANFCTCAKIPIGRANAVNKML